MANSFVYSQETPTEADDFGCITVDDNGDTFVISVGPSKPCFYEISPEVQLYEEQAVELVQWLEDWLSRQKKL